MTEGIKVMRPWAAVAILFVVVDAHAVSITCNGKSMHPVTGRIVGAGTITFDFDFDQQTQTMHFVDGVNRRPLESVSITEGLAKGADSEWIYEINRIDGTASVRANLRNDPKQAALGMGGDY